MHTKARSHGSIFGMSWNPLNAALAIMLTLLFLIFLILFITLSAQPAQGQTYQVIYNFTGGGDGAYPVAGLTLDRAGNLYGTAPFGGYPGGGCTLYGFVGCGTVFKLAPSQSGWRFSTLYSFHGGTDGAWPYAGVMLGADGNLYGETLRGGKTGRGAFSSCGTAFQLKPPATPSSSWQETVIYRFQGGDNGSGPFSGYLVSDQAGNLYGTTDGVVTTGGGCGGDTTAYELSPSQSGWTQSVLYRYTGGSNGSGTNGGLILDGAGNLYGTTIFGGQLGGVCGNFGCGTVFELTRSASGWTNTILYSFQGGTDGEFPSGGLIFDAVGNLYGTTSQGGLGGGTAYELSPSGGSWKETVLYMFNGTRSPSPLVMDAAGNLYGTNFSGGLNGSGNAFKLTPAQNSWTFTSLHEFTGGNDGGDPVGGVIFDAHGKLYGTTQNGGTGANCYDGNCGVVFEITP